MNIQSKYILICCFLLLVVPVFLSSVSGKITATDWTYRHSVWIDQYIHGNFSAAAIYPPLFEFAMLPFVYINFPMAFFEVIFAVMGFSAILYLTYRLEGDKAMILMAMMLASSIAFVEFSSALMPMALDYVLFPIIILLFLKKRVFASGILLFITTFMHPISSVFAVILIFYSIWIKDYRSAKFMLITLLALSPIFIYYSFIVNSAMFPGGYDLSLQYAFDMQYLWPPYIFFGMSGFLTWILLIYALFKYRKIYLSDNQRLYIIWILIFLSFIPFQMGLWRMVSYQIVPLSLLVASILKKEEFNFG